MMTSSNGNIFRVTGHLCGEFTGPRWIPRTNASDAELWCFFDLRLNKRLSNHSWGWWLETPSCPLWRHRNDFLLLFFISAVIGSYPLCPRGCTSCSRFNGCVTCRPRKYLLLERQGMSQTGRCVSACPVGFHGVKIKSFRRCQSKAANTVSGASNY